MGLENNPWKEISRGHFILARDEGAIKEFNASLKPSQRDTYQIHDNIFPEPFLGDPVAPIVLVNLNPGFDERDFKLHAEPNFQNTILANLRHQNLEYPFYLLNPAFKETPGYKWWTRILGNLIKRFSAKLISQKILCVELFGYHSRKFYSKEYLKNIKSQKYSVDLVTDAIGRGAVVIYMRQVKQWNEVVGDLLISYQRKYEVINKQQPYITENNCPDGYREIIKILNAS